MADIQTQLAEALRDRYVLERELGRGGMATVFLAQDLKHDRPVAVKVLRPELAATVGPARFRREIHLAARLQHPHILTVLDSGETAGQLWYTMPYVEGETLRDRLQREGQLPVEEALRIAREAAQALQYAHEHGVVHRDIKPANLLLTRDGNTLVADFGIARVLGGGDERLTETGLSIGTPAYMSPEQAAGEPMLDVRTDLYSLASVLYEMVAGEPPFTGPTAQAIITKRLSAPAPSVRRLRPAVGPGLDQAIQRALAPVPRDRFATMAEFAHALQRATASTATATVPAKATRSLLQRPQASLWAATAAALAIALAAAIGLTRRHEWSVAARAMGSQRLAVLPFENLGDTAELYFTDGITDEVRGKLAAVPGLEVIARSSSNQYKSSSKPAQEIARELGVQYLLTATVRWEKSPGRQSRVRVSPELVRITSGSAPTTMWEQSFDAVLSDVFEVQADVAERVTRALGIALGATERRTLAARPTQNLEAYEAFLRGNDLLERGSRDAVTLRRAVAYYEQAVALDSGFAPAWGRLSRAFSALYANSSGRETDREKSRLAAEQALHLAPGLADGYLALGNYYAAGRRDFTRALDEYRQGLARAPGSADLLRVVAGAEAALGDLDEALRHRREALRLDPRSYHAAEGLVYNLLSLRRHSEALAAADRVIELSPSAADGYHVKALVYLALGDLAQARAALASATGHVDPVSLAITVAEYFDLVWVLDDAQQNLLLRLTPPAFDEDTLAWGLALAETLALRGQGLPARAYADSARSAGEMGLRRTPDNALLQGELGIAYAYGGRTAAAIRAGQRAVRMSPPERDLELGPYLVVQLARIYTMAGQPQKALDQLERLLKIQCYLTPGWLRIDPEFAPLRDNPRFERLVAGK